MKQNENSRLRVLALRARNVKSIREVEITIDGDIHEIRGDAGQGKTSILQSIEGALRGLDPSMVRKGESAAEIELTLSEAIVNRIVAADGSRETLLVTDGNGKPIKQAREFLRTICDPATFRPIEWVRLGGGDPKGKTERLRKQRDQLLEALPMRLDESGIAEELKSLEPEYTEALAAINLDDVDMDQHALAVCSAIEKACYEFRALQNLRAEDAEAALKHTPAPSRPAPRADLATCQKGEQKATAAFHTAKARMSGREGLAEKANALRVKVEAEARELPDPAKVEETAAHYTREGDNAKGEIKRLEELLEAQRGRFREAQMKLAQCDALQRRIDAQAARESDLQAIEAELAAQGETIDFEALRQQMEAAWTDAENRRLQDGHDAAAKKASDSRRSAEIYTGLVEFFRDTLPKKLIGGAKLPVEGLGVDADQILIDGIPLHQLGTSQQIRIGVAIAAALNPRSGFVLVDGAESMGRNDRKALAEAARELGVQLIMTYVDADAQPGPGVTVMRQGQAVEVA